MLFNIIYIIRKLEFKNNVIQLELTRAMTISVRFLAKQMRFGENDSQKTSLYKFK